jgi:hypothetical protein
MNFRYKFYTVVRCLLADVLGVHAVDTIKLEPGTSLRHFPTKSVYVRAEGDCPCVAVVSHGTGAQLTSWQRDLVADAVQAQCELALEEAGGLVGTPEMAFARLKAERPDVGEESPEEAEVKWNEALKLWSATSDGYFCYFIHVDGSVEGPWEMV